MVTQERLKSVIHYDPDTGAFTWIVQKGRSKAGAKAGTLNGCGYVSIWIDGKQYKASRLAWLYVHGKLPVGDVDHINRNRADDRISNLRVGTHAENMQNISWRLANKSGAAGVNWHKKTGKWTAQISVDKKKIYLGVFNRIEDAIAARTAAKAKYHKFHPEDNNEKAA